VGLGALLMTRSDWRSLAARAAPALAALLALGHLRPQTLLAAS